MIRRVALIVLSVLAFSRPAAAQDSGCFVSQLGRDTTGIECYRRTDTRVELEQLSRAPSVVRRTIRFDLANAVTHLSITGIAPGRGDTVQTYEATFGSDSVRALLGDGKSPPRATSTSAPAPGAIVASYNWPWTMYEIAIQRMVAAKSDSLRLQMFVPGLGTTWLSLHRLGADSIDLYNQHLDRFHVRVDPSGRVLGALPISGTGKFTISRVASIDIAAYASAWAANEKAGQGLGILSPRDSVIATVGGAKLWIDYGRPGKRGRLIYGGVVPYGEVWRTGANAATQFKTDRALEFGKGITVPAGFYTLWTVPGPKSWKLIINSETGQWGTAHKDSLDLYTIDMKVTRLPQVAERFTIVVEPRPQGGTLNFDWDTTRASASFTAKP